MKIKFYQEKFKEIHTKMDFIPISKTYFIGRELDYLTECIDTGWASSLGKFIPEFENKFSDFLQVKYSLSCSNGTSALHLALLSLDIGEGDEIITPSLTFIATINVILYCRAKPIFVDIDPVTWCMDPMDVRRKLSKKTKAILPVHLYGNPADISELQKIANENNVFLIEDCAEALGAKFSGNYIGTFGNVSCHSFYGNKIITCGEGGMISTGSKKIYKKISLLRDHGMSPDKRYLHTLLGYNYRMTNLQASVGLAQLANIHNFLNERRKIFDQYIELLKKVDEIKLPFMGDDQKSPVNWLFSVIVKKGNRDDLIEYLYNQGIETRPMFYPCHKMPYINYDSTLPITNSISKAGLSLPTFVGLKREDIIKISEHIKRYFSSHHLK